MRAVVTSLAAEFDVMDIAAAAVKMAHLAAADETGHEAVPTAPSRRPARSTHQPPADGGVVRLWLGAGKKAGIRPGDLVGAIAGEAGVPSSSIGAIQIAETFSVIEVPAALADDIIAAVSAATLRGKKVTVRRDRDRS
jgi:ATP-dependent RNA helicase DeaD